MPTVTIDGKSITVPANTLVVEAAKGLDTHIPVFCYHPKMEPVGMCRMCLVEVGTPRMDPATRKPVLDDKGNPVIAWMPKPQASCTTVVSEGMVVKTNSPAVADARRSVLEFLLTSHPLDCPICDKGGECPLQDHTLNYGPGVSRFRFESKFHNEKAVPLSPLIMLDRERCIQCARCVRFQDQIADEPVLGFADRGRGLEIVTFDDPPFDSKFSGDTIDLCPVGALTSRDFRFSARVFELTDHPGVCVHCSVGCNLFFGERDGEIQRITPRENQAVNEIWLCDKGRFAHHFASSPGRMTRPMIRIEGDLKPVSWYEAFTFIGNTFNPKRIESGGKAFGALTGDRLANEDYYLLQKLYRQVLGSNNLDHRVGWAQWNAGDELVRNFGAGVGTDIGELNKNAAILVLGADPEEEQPVLRLRLSAAAKRGAQLIVANGRLTKLASHAKQSFVYRYGGESYFLLGLLRALLDENLAKTDGANNTSEFAAALSEFSIGQCAEQAGVQEDALRGAARAFASSENAVVLFGRELMFAMLNDASVENYLAALIVLTNHLGRRNNGVIALYPHNNSTGALDMGVHPERGVGRVALNAKGLDATEMLAGKASVLWVIGADPARDGKFSKPGFLIVQDLFMTETAQKADVVLPAQAWSERDGSFTNTERRVQLFRAGSKAPAGTRPDWTIIQEVARLLGAQWNYHSSAEIAREMALTVPLYAGMTYDKLAVKARQRASVLTDGSESSEPVQIALGELFGDVSGAQWASVAESEPNTRFDLKFIAPKPTSRAAGLTLALGRSLSDRGALIAHSPILQPRVPQAYVEVNSHDAEDFLLANNSRVRVTLDCKPPRSMELIARVDGRVPRGVVLIPNNLDGTTNLPMGASVKIEPITNP
ncbi:MAG TPA: NADH-quinone oxidoreductase subunit NuoG [Anaerolineae bacterium]